MQLLLSLRVRTGHSPHFHTGQAYELMFRLYACVCVHICIIMCVCIYTIYVYVHMYVYVYIYMYVHSIYLYIRRAVAGASAPRRHCCAARACAAQEGGEHFAGSLGLLLGLLLHHLLVRVHEHLAPRDLDLLRSMERCISQVLPTCTILRTSNDVSRVPA